MEWVSRDEAQHRLMDGKEVPNKVKSQQVFELQPRIWSVEKHTSDMSLPYEMCPLKLF